MKRLLLCGVLAACSGGSKGPTTPSGGGGTAVAEKVLVNVDAEGVILSGFDAVAYRAEAGKAVSGLPEHSAKFGGATYKFSSADNLAAFKGAEHAPAYGGYCAYAASMGRLSPSDPTVFEIYEGQLLVFTNADFKDQFDADRAGNKAKADAAWPDLVAKNAK